MACEMKALSREQIREVCDRSSESLMRRGGDLSLHLLNCFVCNNSVLLLHFLITAEPGCSLTLKYDGTTKSGCDIWQRPQMNRLSWQVLAREISPAAPSINGRQVTKMKMTEVPFCSAFSENVIISGDVNHA